MGCYAVTGRRGRRCCLHSRTTGSAYFPHSGSLGDTVAVLQEKTGPDPALHHHQEEDLFVLPEHSDDKKRLQDGGQGPGCGQ